MKNRSGIIKIVAAVTGAVSLLCMAVLLVNYLCNEHFISAIVLRPYRMLLYQLP